MWCGLRTSACLPVLTSVDAFGILRDDVEPARRNVKCTNNGAPSVIVWKNTCAWAARVCSCRRLQVHDGSGTTRCLVATRVNHSPSEMTWQTLGGGLDRLRALAQAPHAGGALTLSKVGLCCSYRGSFGDVMDELLTPPPGKVSKPRSRRCGFSSAILFRVRVPLALAPVKLASGDGAEVRTPARRSPGNCMTVGRRRSFLMGRVGPRLQQPPRRGCCGSRARTCSRWRIKTPR